MSGEPARGRSRPRPRLWGRLAPRIVLSSALAAPLSVAAAGGLGTLFLVGEIRVQVARYTEDVVVANLPRCRSLPSAFGRNRDVGRFDAYDASTLLSANPDSPAPDPVLVERLRRGEALPARVYWSWTGPTGGATLKQAAPSGPCSLFQLQWYMPARTRTRMVHVFGAITLLALASAAALSIVVVVRPLVRRLARLSEAAERVGEDDGYEPTNDRDADEVGELSRILDRAHGRILTESTRLKSREEVLERHLADVSHDLRTPLTSTQIALEQASGLVEDREVRNLIRRALTDTVYTSELTENLRMATQLKEAFGPAVPQREVELTGIVERVVNRFAPLGRHRGVQVESAVPGGSVATRGHPLWVEQAVTNLVHHAVSNGGEGGHVAVLLESADRDAFRLTVLDDGPPAPDARPPDDAGGTYRPERGRPRDPSGRGLALAIVALVCRIHKWTLNLGAGPSGGRMVTIEGALVTAPAEPERAAVAHGSETALPSALRRSREREAEVGAPSLSDEAAAPAVAVAAEAWGRRSQLWRQLTPRILLAAGLGASVGIVGIGLVLAPIIAREVLMQMKRYTRDVTADGFAVCLASPATWSHVRQAGRLDAYDAATLRSPNAGSPPPDPALVERARAGDPNPARIFWSWDGQWGGVVLRQLLPGGPCSLFQMSWRAPAGSVWRGLGLLLAVAVLSLAATFTLGTVIAVRPLVSRLVRLRRAAERLGREEAYEPGTDPEDDEIGRLSAIVDRAHARVRLESQRLKARQKALERHLGDIAHDLRTPLTSAHISLEQAARLLDGEARALVRGALSDIVYTSELTENLRLATQLREGGNPLEGDVVTDLAAVVDRVVARFSLLGRNRGVTLEGASPGRTVIARGHPIWAEQAVANVVHNAVTHGPEGTRVAVLLELEPQQEFAITVVDDGPGVPPTDLARLSERKFRSSRAHRRDPGGSGLGLAITAEICRRSGWSLRYEPEQPRGLKVTIQGPLASRPGNGGGGPTAGGPGLPSGAALSKTAA